MYATLLAETLARLELGPTIAEVQQRDNIGANLQTLHIGARGRHIILSRAARMPDGIIKVLRILHDAMDLVRHPPAED